jgi:hypothetical protein
MARRTRIIEGTWDCTSCGSKGVLGRHKVCPGCGNPREEAAESSFDFGPPTESGASTRETVTDAEALASAAAGADWYCAFCGTANRGDGLACRACAAERAQNADVPMLPPEPERALSMPPPGPAKRGCMKPALLGCLGLGGALLAFLVALGIWGSRTHEARGQIASRSWKREIARETFTRVTRSGWRDELRERRSVMPARGTGETSGIERIRDCARKQRGTRQVATGTHRVCSDRTRRVQCGTEEKCHRKDLGNGFAEEVCDDVPKYCDQSYEDCRDETTYRSEPVYGEECRFDTWEWQPGAGAVAEGSSDTPSWPAISLGSLDRDRRKESYAVVVTYGKGRSTRSSPRPRASSPPMPPEDRSTSSSTTSVASSRLAPTLGRPLRGTSVDDEKRVRACVEDDASARREALLDLWSQFLRTRVREADRRRLHRPRSLPRFLGEAGGRRHAQDPALA